MMKFVYLFSSLSLSVMAFSQGSLIELELRRKIDHGAKLMAQGFYDSAQVEFLYVLENMARLPSEMAYYFGRNSYHLNKYKQGINWLNKYIQLKGTRGRYYEPAVQYLQYAEDEYMKIQRGHTKRLAEELNSANYDCGGLEKMICPVCHGSGVVVTNGTFDEVYKTCPYSLGEGYLSCGEYNLFMRGKLEVKLKN